MQEFNADNETDENEKAADLERNCNLDEPLTMNNNDEQRQNFHDEVNLREQKIVEVNKQQLEVFRQDKIVEVDNDVRYFETGEGDMRNVSDEDADQETEDQEIAGVQNLNKNDEDLRRGERKRSRNPCYLNAETVSSIMVGGDSQDNEVLSHGKLYDENDENMRVIIFEYILAQYSLKQGLKKYGKLAEQATENELLQIHNMDALQPLDADKFTEEKKKGTIASLIF